MAATLDAVRGAFPGRRIVLAFQPHRYTRTRDCFEDFVKVLSTVDVLVLTEVYAAGEAPIVAADGRALARAVRVQGKTEPIFVEQVSEIPDGDPGGGEAGRRDPHHGRGLDRRRTGEARSPSERRERARMNMAESISILAGGLRGVLRREEPMSKHTSWRVGGPAERAYLPADLEDLRAFLGGLPADEPVYAVGLGSNLLVRDGGLRGTVVFMHHGLKVLRLDEGRHGRPLVYAEAGVASPKVARFAANHGFEGAEFLAGIPGTVGGALAMNAGCYGSETWDVVERVLTLDHGGQLRTRPPGDYEIGYRHCRRKENGHREWFAAAWLQVQPGDGEAARERIKALLTRRIASQPSTSRTRDRCFATRPVITRRG